MTTSFDKSADLAEELIIKAKDVAKGKTLAAAGIDSAWLTAYAEIARRCREDKKFGLSRYPYEPGPSVSAFTCGFFEHRQWPIRLALERQSSMKPVATYEVNYMNASGYRLAFHESAIQLRQESLEAKDTEKAAKFDVWALISVRYALRVVGLRTEFYKMAADDPVTAKMLLSGLERQNDMQAADDTVDTMEKLDSHMTTQLFKAVAILKISNAGKKIGGKNKGGAADDK